VDIELTEEKGKKPSLQEGGNVDVVLEADSDATMKKPEWSDARLLECGSLPWLGLTRWLPLLLERTRNAGEHIVGVGADEPNCSNYYHEDDGQHHRVLGNVLSLVFTPKRQKTVHRKHPRP
jgi:hypothetical protein